jgi:hypothetical protein
MSGQRTGNPRTSPLSRLARRGLLVCGTATLALGSLGLWHEHAAKGPWHGASAVFFDVAGMLVLEHPDQSPDNWAYSLARVTAVSTAGLGVVYLLLGVYRETADDWSLRRMVRKATANRRPLVVVCGLGRIGLQLVRDLTGTASVVAIEGDPGSGHIERARECGALVLVGDARDGAVRARAGIDVAREVFVVCGSDAVNPDIAASLAAQAASPAGRRMTPLHCLASVVSPALTKAAREHPAFSGQPSIRVEPFNVIEGAARLLVAEELAGRHVPGTADVAHYLLFGFGTMGQNVALQAARLAHFENDLRLRMTIVDDWGDQAVETARRRFLERHPAFCPDPAAFGLLPHVRSRVAGRDGWTWRAGRPASEGWRLGVPAGRGARMPIEYVVNAEFLDLPGEVDAPDLVDRIALRVTADQDPQVRACAVVCFDEDTRNFEAALRLSAALFRGGRPLPLYVYLPDQAGLGTFLQRRLGEEALPEVRAFGACEISASHSRLVQPALEAMAQAFHGRHRTTAHAAVPSAAARALEPVFRGSSQEAAYHASIKLAAVARMRGAPGAPACDREGSFSKAEREVLARMEHNRYLAERLLDGWRYGERDDVRKRRPSLVPWDQLSEEERARDFDQIDALAACADLGVAPVRDRNADSAPAQTRRGPSVV